MVGESIFSMVFGLWILLSGPYFLIINLNMPQHCRVHILQ
jgi:hypothetical protein